MTQPLGLLKVGIEFVVIISALTAVGYKTDQFFFSQPKGIISGMIVGTIVGFLNVWRTLQRQALRNSAVPKNLKN